MHFVNRFTWPNFPISNPKKKIWDKDWHNTAANFQGTVLTVSFWILAPSQKENLFRFLILDEKISVKDIQSINLWLAFMSTVRCQVYNIHLSCGIGKIGWKWQIFVEKVVFLGPGGPLRIPGSLIGKHHCNSCSLYLGIARWGSLNACQDGLGHSCSEKNRKQTTRDQTRENFNLVDLILELAFLI